MKTIKRFIAVLIALTTIISSFAVMAGAANISVVNGRSDGKWLFPLGSNYYQSISDWAGCHANPSTIGSCPFHGNGCKHNAKCGADHYTYQGQFGHNGIDIAAGKGVPVMASAPGTLYYVEYNLGSRGLTAVVEHKINDNDSYYSYYQHLNGFNKNFKNGSSVKAGDVIGYVGNSGGNYGCHLHFGIVFGQAGKGNNAKTGEYLNTLEGYGWITTKDYKYGRIVVNPDSTNADTKLDTVNCHRGSVHYVFDKSEVKIGTHICSAATSQLVKYESAHPHYAVYKCSCGKTWTDKSKTQVNSDCDICQGKPVFSGMSKPTSVKLGTSFGLRGTITSTKKITKVTAGIYTDENGKNAVQCVEVTPNSKTYNLNGKVNDSLIFGKLKKGTYYYIVVATANKKTETFKQKFTVVSSITISGATKPGNVKKGSCFGLRGTISDVRKMTNVTAGIYTDANGKNAKQKISVNPDATSYNLNGKVNNSLIFNKLPKGTFYYRVTAKDSYGTEILINQKFTVS